MGVVYLSWDVVLRQVVAIKTVSGALRAIPEHVHTLRKEAALQIGLSHESIVRVLHFEPQERTVGPYMIMEYVPWASGDRWLAEAGLSGLPVRSVVSVGLRLCEALSCAHASNVLHGDIKPTNVFVGPTGDRAKLADFGIAQVLGARERNALVTKLVGTPAYMAPEQRRLGAKIGPWTDVYLLARTLGEFLGGRATKERLMELPDDAWTEPVVPVLRRGLAPDPRERPKDAEEFAALLSDVLPAVA
jgi:eukaryotic-like serine/threonine-protein kinase